MTPRDDAPLEALATSMLDDAAVDWEAAESGASSPSQRDIVRNLRVLASVAEVHTAGELGWGSLRIREKIGQGAFGDVYRGWDPRLDREVAIKLLRRGDVATSTDSAIEEGRLLARVRHPNVVTVYGAERRDGCVGLWMEFIHGRTLEQIVKHNGVFGASEAAMVGVTVCQAVSAVHAAGLLHRDIKSHNVMREEGGRIVLMDFGVGKDLTRNDASVRELAGTPIYLAPELFEGIAASPSSDIYSIGVLLFRLVTAGYPLTGHTLEEIRELHRRGAHRRLRDARPDLSARFVTVVERALAAEPRERYQTAGEMEAALLGCLDGRPEPKSVRSRPSLRTVASRWLLPAALAVVLASIGGSRMTLHLPSAAPAAFEALAVLPLRDLSDTRNAGDFADAMTDALIGELSRIRPIRVVSRASSMVYKDSPKPVKDIAQELNVDVLVEASVHRADDRVRLDARLVDAKADRTIWSQRFERQRLEDVPALQIELAGAIAYELRAQLPATPRIHRSIDPVAYLTHLKGRALLSKRTPEAMRSARALFEQAIDSDPTYAPAHAGLADAYTLLGAFGVLPKVETVPRARAAAARALELEPTLADAHVALAFVLSDESDRFGAMRELKLATDLSPNHAGAHHWYALLLVGVEQFAEAIAEIERARALDPLSMIIGSDAGVVYMRAGQIDKAIERLEHTTSIHPEFAEGHTQLALAYEEKGWFEACYRKLQEAYRLSPGSVMALEHLTWAAARTGRRREAEERLAQLRALEPSGTVTTSSLAAIYAALGQTDEAFRYVEKDLAERMIWAGGLVADPKTIPRLEVLTRDPRFPEFQRRVLAAKHSPSWPAQRTEPADVAPKRPQR